MIRVTVWNEFYHEQQEGEAKKLYPNGIHQVIADFLRCDDIAVRTATLEEPECGLTQEVLDETDVLIWWGHLRHDKVPDAVADRVHQEILRGMGFICLHSGHESKVFQRLVGTTANVYWREDGDYARLWVVDPTHPITKGIDRFVYVEEEETYCEPFGIPQPDELLFITAYEGGEVFRSGFTLYRQNGRIFYFQPGHETYPVYYNPQVQQVIRNAVYWANPVHRVKDVSSVHIEKLTAK